jgi:hypothetical protein
MTMTDAKPFRDAMAELARKRLMPTSLSSAELRVLGRSVTSQSFFSARTLIEDLLASYKSKVAAMIEPKQIERDGKPVTVGLDQATARLQIKQLLAAMGYQPEAGKAGTIEDLSSEGRINLVLETNRRLAQSGGRLVQANEPEVIEAWPAWEFMRVEDRNEPRNWPVRWRNAAETAGDERSLGVLGKTGRMVALKASKLWDALGDGAGGYEDTLGDGRLDPVAFRTGMGREDVSRDEAVELGLIGEGDEAPRMVLDLGNLFGVE